MTIAGQSGRTALRWVRSLIVRSTSEQRRNALSDDGITQRFDYTPWGALQAGSTCPLEGASPPQAGGGVLPGSIPLHLPDRRLPFR